MSSSNLSEELTLSTTLPAAPQTLEQAPKDFRDPHDVTGQAISQSDDGGKECVLTNIKTEHDADASVTPTSEVDPVYHVVNCLPSTNSFSGTEHESANVDIKREEETHQFEALEHEAIARNEGRNDSITSKHSQDNVVTEEFVTAATSAEFSAEAASTVLSLAATVTVTMDAQSGAKNLPDIPMIAEGFANELQEADAVALVDSAIISTAAVGDSTEVAVTDTVATAHVDPLSATDVVIEPAEGEAEAVVNNEENQVGGIWDPAGMDILSGRGASVNAHNGNMRFRALCFSRKPEFDAGNHAAKRRIATEIVQTCFNKWGCRFLKRKAQKDPWFEMSFEQALLKACQVMRDHRRPDRLAQRGDGSNKKRNRATATPILEGITIPEGPIAPIVENPFGVHDHDVLCGRGAFVNGHIGNQRLRDLAMERKIAFDNGNFAEKRTLATEIVMHIRCLDPPGRFLSKIRKNSKALVSTTSDADGLGKTDDKNVQQECEWEELPDERAIHKACQVMRDIDRPDRKDREERRKLRKLKKEGSITESIDNENDTKSLLAPSLECAGDSAVTPALLGMMEVVGITDAKHNFVITGDSETAPTAVGSEILDAKEHKLNNDITDLHQHEVSTNDVDDDCDIDHNSIVEAAVETVDKALAATIV